jgi:hypothetical protein
VFLMDYCKGFECRFAGEGNKLIATVGQQPIVVLPVDLLAALVKVCTTIAGNVEVTGKSLALIGVDVDLVGRLVGGGHVRISVGCFDAEGSNLGGLVSDFGGCGTRLNSVYIVLRPDVREIIRKRVDRLTILVGSGVVGGSVVVGVGFDVGHVRINVVCC